MLQALLRGKLSLEQENMEDILTSNVFGLLQYMRPSSALFRFIAQAQDLDEKHPLEWLTDVPASDCTVQYDFWPSWQKGGRGGCEPDVVLTVCAADRPAQLILIEAKFRSGKSENAESADGKPSDQLAREWDNLAARASTIGAEPTVIYLTQDFCMPRADIRASVEEYRKHRGATAKILWLSWRHLQRALASNPSPPAQDLILLLRRLGLYFFDGTGTCMPVPDIWTFCEPAYCWTRGFGPTTSIWRFRT